MASLWRFMKINPVSSNGASFSLSGSLTHGGGAHRQSFGRPLQSIPFDSQSFAHRDQRPTQSRGAQFGEAVHDDDDNELHRKQPGRRREGGGEKENNSLL